MHEVIESTPKEEVINQVREDQECYNEKVSDSNYEINQGMDVSNMACQEETSNQLKWQCVLKHKKMLKN